MLNLWQKNGVFKIEVIQPLLDMAAGSTSAAAPYIGTEEPGNYIGLIPLYYISTTHMETDRPVSMNDAGDVPPQVLPHLRPKNHLLPFLLLSCKTPRPLLLWHSSSSLHRVSRCVLKHRLACFHYLGILALSIIDFSLFHHCCFVLCLLAFVAPTDAAKLSAAATES